MRSDWAVDGMEDFGFHGRLGMVEPATVAVKDCAVVRRSLMQQFPSAAISFREAEAVDVPLKRRAFLSNRTILATEPPLNARPASGQGPPFWVLRTGSSAGVAFAGGRWSAEDGTVAGSGARVNFQGIQGPLFTGTARMATELALKLAADGPRGQKGGYLTPTTAVGIRNLEELLSRVDKGALLKLTHESH
mmetsp:Transcript_63655/g.179149  ORF Transcript_63655/g.179149 Transcript_63655/m.179149 type:complete len:191 (+) Transcript_63655:1-573(+)